MHRRIFIFILISTPNDDSLDLHEWFLETSGLRDMWASAYDWPGYQTCAEDYMFQYFIFLWDYFHASSKGGQWRPLELTVLSNYWVLHNTDNV